MKANNYDCSIQHLHRMMVENEQLFYQLNVRDNFTLCDGSGAKWEWTMFRLLTMHSSAFPFGINRGKEKIHFCVQRFRTSSSWVLACLDSLHLHACVCVCVHVHMHIYGGHFCSKMMFHSVKTLLSCSTNPTAVCLVYFQGSNCRCRWTWTPHPFAESPMPMSM